MLALDTNVLVRYLVEDDEDQTALATSLIDRTIVRGDTLFISDVVVCETVWVLNFSYKTKRSEIVQVLRNLFRARHLEFGAVDQLVRALELYSNGKGDFADYLIQQQSRAFQCESVATFDERLLKERGFSAVR